MTSEFEAWRHEALLVETPNRFLKTESGCCHRYLWEKNGDGNNSKEPCMREEYKLRSVLHKTILLIRPLQKH